ncbi:CAAX prenyl protease-like protein [Fontibacillus phaseoli]|uniref:CAAX prenyl protease-like protein n=1 Tax=Fontibacillus phaseoli TaxID=1416533 RepID=A0A369BEK8_9BACL|nr:type II CAAX endopeptidase family protein [Fontibacillus phaseoli]RCX19695.1 CAAX prenyl protease-like protein [Fontibacillus phaseoli]
MDSYSKPQMRRMKTRTLWIFAAIGLIVFILLQIVPATASETLQMEQSAELITKAQAEESALKFAESTLGLSGPFEDALVTYETRADIYGYLTKEDLMEDYLKKYEKQFPYDIFQVRFKKPGGLLNALTVDVHMTTGKVVGFKEIPETGFPNVVDLGINGSSDAVSASSGVEGLTWEEKLALAQPYLKALGYSADTQLVVDETPAGLALTVTGFEAGQSNAQIDIDFYEGKVSGIESYFTVPQSHTDYVKGQTTIANWLTYAGYALLTFVLGILAIVYSALTKVHTSFKRGILLSSIYFVISMGSAINMLPYFEKEGLSGPLLIFGLLFQGGVTLVLAASVYFSLVGGDGLWRQQGINLWGRAKEQGYGRHVLTSMADGYAWALILLGVQSVIFFVLERTIHMWSTTDASQSPYNMVYPVLLPLLAWVAGIGEEAVYRLFGIPMLKKMFRSTLVASVITTLIWAFGHTLYPIYPVISRPIELLIIGLLFSFIFLRYGFIAVLFSHVIFDSILMSLSIMFTGGTVNIAAGIFYIALPAIVAFVIYLFNPPGKERPPVPAQKKEEPLFTTPHPEGHL